MAENYGLTLLNLKRRSEYSLVTTTNVETCQDLETPAVSPLVADPDDRLSEIAISIRAANLEPLPKLCPYPSEVCAARVARCPCKI